MNKAPDKQEWIDRAVDFLDRAELWGMTLITKVIAFLTPIPVSLQTKTHAMKYLGYSEFWSWVIALIVEFLGYASIYKALQFAEHNRRYTDPKNKAPFKLAIATYIFYLVAVIVFNVIPEVATQKPSHIIAMNVVLALFSVPGGVIAGISAIFTERKAALKRKPNEQPNTTPNEQPNSRTPNTPERRTPERPNTVPQPTNEHPFQIPNTERPNTERTQRIEQAARTLEAELNRQPSVREIQQRLREQDGTDTGWSTSTISGALKK